MSLRRTVKVSQRYGHRIETEPAQGPVDTDELRTHMSIGADALPADLAQQLIETARAEIEDEIGVALIDQEWKLTLDHWPNEGHDEWWDGSRQGSINQIHAPSGAWIELPRWPLDSITSVTTYDTAGNSTAITVSSYFDVDTNSERGRMALKFGQAWPAALRPTNAIEIVYKSGYGATEADVPMPMKRAVLEMAAHLFTHRGDCDGGKQCAGVQRLLRKYKKGRI